MLKPNTGHQPEYIILTVKLWWQHHAVGMPDTGQSWKTIRVDKLLHTARVTMESKHIHVLEWPSQSRLLKSY